MHENPIAEAVYRCGEYGGGTDEVWNLCENATIRPGSGPSIWDGLSITHWSDDA